MTNWTRREFIAGTTAVAAGAGLSVGTAFGQAAGTQAKPAKTAHASTAPVVIASGNGLATVQKAGDMIVAGSDPLDAAIAGVAIVEADPDDHSVGLGGLPNEDGVVELDSSVMHGPTGNAGSVGALRNIVHPAQVARLVMQRTDHVMIVGEGALRFAKAHGFKEAELLTDEARRIWLKWKETHSDIDDWLPPPTALQPAGAPGEKSSRANGPSQQARPDRSALGDQGELAFTYGTINCCALDAAGNLGGVTTTSGLSYKIPGRVGDSPIIGAGLFVDNEVGAAGATGRGEAVIKTCGSHTVVEAMRHGQSPREACLLALRRIADNTKRNKRLQRNDGRPNFNVCYYAVAKDGRFGSASMWSGPTFAIYAAGQARIEKSAYLYKQDS